MKYLRQANGINYDVYSLEMIVAIAFRICSKESMAFRRYVTHKVSETAKASPTMLFVSVGRIGNVWGC